MVELKNGILEVKLTEIGAEIKSVVKNGVEYMWPGKEIWLQTAPMLFPICSGLKDDKYILDGVEYHMGKHGFTRNAPFVLESADEKSVTYLLCESEETLKVYPFKFELRIVYTLDGDKIKVEYKVKNKNDKKMYFSIGAHEAYYTPEGIDAYDVIFSEKESLKSSYFGDGTVLNSTFQLTENTDTYHLTDKIFEEVDSIIIRTLKSRSATLINRETKRGVKIDFPFASAFLIWHMKGANYICLEPWAGFPDVEGTDHDFTKKEGIIPIKIGEEYIGEHTLTFM